MSSVLKRVIENTLHARLRYATDCIQFTSLLKPRSYMMHDFVCVWVSVSCSTNSAKSHTNVSPTHSRKTFHAPSSPGSHKYACAACMLAGRRVAASLYNIDLGLRRGHFPQRSVSISLACAFLRNARIEFNENSSHCTLAYRITAYDTLRNARIPAQVERAFIYCVYMLDTLLLAQRARYARICTHTHAIRDVCNLSVRRRAFLTRTQQPHV